MKTCTKIQNVFYVFPVDPAANLWFQIYSIYNGHNLKKVKAYYCFGTKFSESAILARPWHELLSAKSCYCCPVWLSGTASRAYLSRPDLLVIYVFRAYPALNLRLKIQVLCRAVLRASEHFLYGNLCAGRLKPEFEIWFEICSLTQWTVRYDSADSDLRFTRCMGIIILLQ